MGFLFPPDRPTTFDPAADWSDETDKWAVDLALQGAGGGRYLVTAIAFSLDVNSDGIIFLGG